MDKTSVERWLATGTFVAVTPTTLPIPDGLLLMRVEPSTAVEPEFLVAVCDEFVGGTPAIILGEVLLLLRPVQGKKSPGFKLLLVDARKSPEALDIDLGWFVRVLSRQTPAVRVRFGCLEEKPTGPVFSCRTPKGASKWYQPDILQRAVRAATGSGAISLASSVPPHATRRRGWSSVQPFPVGDAHLRQAGRVLPPAESLDAAELRLLERIADDAPVNMRTRQVPRNPGLLLDVELARGALSRVAVDASLPSTTWALAVDDDQSSLLLVRDRSGDVFAASSLSSNDEDPSDRRGFRLRVLEHLVAAVLACSRLRSNPDILKLLPAECRAPQPLLVVEHPEGPDEELVENLRVELRETRGLAALLGVQIREPRFRKFSAPGTLLGGLFGQLKRRGICEPQPPPWFRKPGGTTVKVCFDKIDEPLRLLPFTATDVFRASAAVLKGLPSPGDPLNEQDDLDDLSDHLDWLNKAWAEDLEGQEKIRHHMQECGKEALAYYRLFHTEREDWGIYLHVDAIGLYCQYLFRLQTATGSPPFSGLQFLEIFGALIVTILGHEWHHHVEEVGASGLEVLQSTKRLLPWYAAYYNPGSNAINETLANADAISTIEGYLGVPDRAPPGLLALGRGLPKPKVESLLKMAEFEASSGPGTYGMWARARRSTVLPENSSDYDKVAAEWLAEVVGTPTGPVVIADDRVSSFHAHRLVYASSYSQSVPVRLFTRVDQQRLERVFVGLKECHRRLKW